MPIDVHCDCGNVFSVGLELSGKKLRCKTCAVVLKVPLVPIGDSQDSGPPSMEYEVVKDEGPAPVTCPTCGAAGKPGDAVCLACGAELEGGAPGLVEKVPKTVIISVIAVVVLAVLGVAGWKIMGSARLSGQITKGRERLDKGDLKGARAAFEEVLREHKDYLPALEGLVQVGVTEGKWTSVKQYGPSLVSRLPKGEKRARAKLDLARAQLETSDYQTAARTARDAASDDPNLAGTDEVVGLALLGANEKLEALEILKKADSSGSTDPRVALGLAKLTEANGDVKGARTWADKASANAGSDASVWLECARLRDKDGDRGAALGALRRACEADKKSARARTLLAVELLEQGPLRDPKAALVIAKEARDLSPEDPVACRALGEALLEAKDYAQARIELEHAEKIAGDDPQPSFLLGKTLILSGEQGTGVEKLERSLRKNDKDAMAWLDAGRLVLAETIQSDKAIAFLDRAVALEPKSPSPQDRKTFAEARALLARALAKPEGGRLKNQRRIEDCLREALNLDPRRKEAYFELGAHFQELENPKGAAEALGKGLEIFPDDEDLLFKAGVAEIKSKQFQAAVEHLSKLISKKPDYPDARNKLEAAKYGLEFDK